MIRVERLLGPRQVNHFVGPLLPGQCDEPIEVRPRDRELCSGRRHLRETIELAKGFLLHGLRHLRRLDLVAQLLDLASLVVAFAQLLLDRFELLAEEILALILADFGLHL